MWSARGEGAGSATPSCYVLEAKSRSASKFQGSTGIIYIKTHIPTICWNYILPQLHTVNFPRFRIVTPPPPLGGGAGVTVWLCAWVWKYRPCQILRTPLNWKQSPTLWLLQRIDYEVKKKQCWGAETDFLDLQQNKKENPCLCSINESLASELRSITCRITLGLNNFHGCPRWVIDIFPHNFTIKRSNYMKATFITLFICISDDNF